MPTVNTNEWLEVKIRRPSWKDNALMKWDLDKASATLGHVLLKNNQRSAPMMAASPLFSTTIITSHLHQTCIGAPSEYFLHSATTNTTCITIIAITNQHHVLSTAAQPEPHHTPHTFHVLGQSHCARTCSWGHELRSPQGPARIYIGILWHHPEYESPCYLFILLPYALQVNSLYVYVSPLYEYSSLLYVFH